MHYDVCISIIIGCSLSVPAGWRSPIYDFIAGRAVCHDGAAKPVHREKCIEEEREREREPSFEHEPIVARLFLRLLNRRGEKKKKKERLFPFRSFFFFFFFFFFFSSSKWISRKKVLSSPILFFLPLFSLIRPSTAPI